MAKAELKEAPKKKRKIKLKIFLAIIAIPVIYVLFNYQQVHSYARNDQVDSNTKADAILVLGAAQFNGRPSKVLEARLDHALSLYERGIAPKIIVTGGNQPGDITTEASASANYLIANGVDDANILREVQGNSTYNSIRDTSVFARDQNIKKVVIVTDGFHMLRSKLIAKEFSMEVVTSPAEQSPIVGKAEQRYFVSETLRVSAGRIIGFRRVSKDSSILQLVK